jgi:hypothetical protein
MWILVIYAMSGVGSHTLAAGQFKTKAECSKAGEQFRSTVGVTFDYFAFVCEKD